MALTNSEVITTEPIPKVQEIGEEVNQCEGICSRHEMIRDVCCSFAMKGMDGILSFVCIPFCIPIGICCGIRAANAWRLYFTSSAIHYQYRYEGLCLSTHEIPFSKIESIQSEGHKVFVQMIPIPSDSNEVTNTGCCGKPRSVPVRLNIFIISHCENAAEFVKAVQEQMAK